MWIISQDKDCIVNANRLNFFKIEPNEEDFDIEINYADDEWDVIGTYDSFERAKEVMTELVNTHLKVARVENGNCKGGKEPKFYNIPKAYYMPEK